MRRREFIALMGASATWPFAAMAQQPGRTYRGLVHSLARPNGNTTGVSGLASDTDGKRQDILIEAYPGMRLMAVLADVNFTSAAKHDALQEAARTRGIELSIHRVARAEEIAAALDGVQVSGTTALNILTSMLLFDHRRHLLRVLASAIFESEVQKITIARLPFICGGLA
jgi:ABC-type uncharacterized transport system substrate-binding protein